jgi:peptidoglycan/xylan/chitin deacetylase (PgdA/CDA1 family)
LITLINILCHIIPVGAEDDLVKDADIFRKNENASMKIALTFDDGPHPVQTPKILDLLDKYGIKATFFTVGINATYYSDTLDMVSRRGHEIGNHTFTHPQVSSLDPENLKDEVERCESTIYGLTDRKTKLFRPPEGMIDSDVKKVLGKLDYKVILWDIDTKDWAHTPPEKIAENVISNISSGDIILMHDYISYNSPTLEALELFIPALLEKGYSFVVVSELIGINGKDPKP